MWTVYSDSTAVCCDNPEFKLGIEPYTVHPPRLPLCCFWLVSAVDAHSDCFNIASFIFHRLCHSLPALTVEGLISNCPRATETALKGRRYPSVELNVMNDCETLRGDSDA